ncbi:MAG: hypothetical protein ABIG63_00270, partial [Chloroflexota bacterium]
PNNGNEFFVHGFTRILRIKRKNKEKIRGIREIRVQNSLLGLFRNKSNVFVSAYPPVIPQKGRCARSVLCDEAISHFAG